MEQSYSSCNNNKEYFDKLLDKRVIIHSFVIIQYHNLPFF